MTRERRPAAGPGLRRGLRIAVAGVFAAACSRAAPSGDGGPPTRPPSQAGADPAAATLPASSRAGAAPADAAAPLAPTDASSRAPNGPAAGSSAGPSDTASSAAGAGEAERRTLSDLASDPRLKPFLGLLRAHFGAGSGPFEFQHIDLAGGRSALLLTRRKESPVVLAVDRDALAWSKLRPVAGITAPVLHLALAPRPDGGVALFVYVASLHLVAARMWADDGNAFAEIEVGSFDACDALAASYGPGLGWVVVCAAPQGDRAQLLREDGTTAWGAAGVAVGASGAAGPPSVAFDTTSTWVLAQRVRGAAADHALAWRYDAQARPVWATATDLGALPPARSPLSEERLSASARSGGRVRVDLPGGPSGRGARTIQIEPDGAFRLVPR